MNIYTGNEQSEAVVDQLVDDVEKYTLANHIFWGLWGLISVTMCRFFMSILEDISACVGSC